MVLVLRVGDTQLVRQSYSLPQSNGVAESNNDPVSARVCVAVASTVAVTVTCDAHAVQVTKQAVSIASRVVIVVVVIVVMVVMVVLGPWEATRPV